MKFEIFHVEIEARRLIVSKTFGILGAIEKDPVAEIFFVGVRLEMIVILFKGKSKLKISKPSKIEDVAKCSGIW